MVFFTLYRDAAPKSLHLLVFIPALKENAVDVVFLSV